MSNPTIERNISAVTGETKKKLKPGILYIFEYEIFDDSLELDERRGSAYDVSSLSNSFAAYQVLLYSCKNLTCSETYSACSQIAVKDFSEHSCIIVAFLSHGFQNYQIAAKDGIFNFYNLVLKICTNPTLKGKPKIFIVQACRGGIDMIAKLRSDNGIVKSDVSDNVVNSMQLLSLEDSGGSSSKTDLYCDELYLLHSATEEFVSYRMPDKGSIFIQEFCKFFQKYAVNVSIEVIFEMVMRSVQKMSIKCQLPEMRKNAVKPYIFGSFSETVENIIKDQKKFWLDVEKIYSFDYFAMRSLNHNSWILIENKYSEIDDFEIELVLPLEKIDNWTRFCLRTAPKYPVIGGHDIAGRLLFVGHVIYENEVIPGKVFSYMPGISFPYEGKEWIGNKFEILNGSGYKWIKADGNGHVPVNAVPGGKKINGEILYVGRAEHMNSLQPGCIQPSDKCLYVSFYGEVLKFIEYEVLVRENV